MHETAVKALIDEVMSDEETFWIELDCADCLLLYSMACEVVLKARGLGTEPSNAACLAMHLAEPITQLHPKIEEHLKDLLVAALHIATAD